MNIYLFFGIIILYTYCLYNKYKEEITKITDDKNRLKKQLVDSNRQNENLYEENFKIQQSTNNIYTGEELKDMV